MFTLSRFCLIKTNAVNDAIQTLVSTKHQRCLRSACERHLLNVNNADYIDYILEYSPQWQKMVPGEKNCWINYVIIVFFAHKMYYCCFEKLQLNPWCHMDYFSDVLSTFLCLDRGSILAVYGRVRELSDFIKISQLVIRRYTKVEMGGQ